MVATGTFFDGSIRVPYTAGNFLNFFGGSRIRDLVKRIIGLYYYRIHNSISKNGFNIILNPLTISLFLDPKKVKKIFGCI